MLCLPLGHAQKAAAAELCLLTEHSNIPPLEEAMTLPEAGRQRQAFALRVELLAKMSQYTSFRSLIQKHEGLHTGRFAIIGHVGGGAEAGLVGLFCFLACMTRRAME